MLRVTLRQYEYIVAVSDRGGFIKAAKHCCVSQPTLSGQIMKAEALLGIKIFKRENKYIGLTNEGKLVVDAARGLLLMAKGVEALKGKTD